MSRPPQQRAVEGPFLDTPHGRLYRPLGEGWQILVLAGAFFGSVAFGWLVGRVPGDLSENARNVLHVPYVVVLFLGYAWWIARLHAIAFDTIGRSLLGALFTLMVHRRKPTSAEDLLPSREKLVEMAVRAQKAGASFAAAGWPIGILAGLAALLVDSAMGAVGRFCLVAGTCVGWGYVLGRLGRRGWLPMMEES